MSANMGFPSGGVPNQGWKLYLTSLIMIIFAGLFVIAKVFTRLRYGRLASDDYAIVASLAFSIVLSVNIQLAVVHGYGKHKYDLSTEELRTCLKFFWIAQTPYKLVVCLNKTSVVLLYKRIFITKQFQYLCWATLAIVVGSGFSTSIATIFQCLPIERSWNKSVEGTCIDNGMFWLANAVLNIATDVIVLALPIREVFNLHLRLQEKLALCGVFLLGGFVTITSILRVTAVANSVQNAQDQTYNFIPRGIWTLIEANLGIICSCLPALRQLAKRIFPFIFSQTKSGPTSGRVTGGSRPQLSAFESRHHHKLGSNVEEEAHRPNSLYPYKEADDDSSTESRMFEMGYLRQGGSVEARRSDEKSIISDDRSRQGGNSGNVEQEEYTASGWPKIVRKVDIEVKSLTQSPKR